MMLWKSPRLVAFLVLLVAVLAPRAVQADPNDHTDYWDYPPEATKEEANRKCQKYVDKEMPGAICKAKECDTGKFCWYYLLPPSKRGRRQRHERRQLRQQRGGGVRAMIHQEHKNKENMEWQNAAVRL